MLAVPLGCGDRSPSLLAPPAPPKAAPAGVPHATRPPVRPSPAVPGELIVDVADGRSIEEVHASFGTSTVHSLPGTPTYLVAAPLGVPLADLAAGIANSQLCSGVDLNYLIETPESEQGSFAFYDGGFDHGDYVDQGALARIGAPAAHAVSTGAGVLVAVIDTGIDLDHPDLADNLGPAGYDFVDEDAVPADLPDGIDEDGDGEVDEATGHGTHVAGIIAAAAPDVVLLPLRALDSDGTGTAYDVTRAIRYAISAGAQVINLSLGLDSTVEAMEDAIQDARDARILVVASAGNRGVQDENHFPARLSEVMAVAATNDQDLKATFSSYGHHISVSAPGVGIMSTYWNGGYAIWSGTSMAAPFVAGAGAVLLAVAAGDAEEARRAIEDTSFDLDREQQPYHGLLGEGRIDLLSLVLASEGGGDLGGGSAGRGD